jgi:subtilisin family serine protease
VINLSLSTLRRTSLLKQILDRVCSDGTGNPNLVVVAAAGNGGDFTEQYPAAESVGGLIAVAASTDKDQLATFSTRGSWIRVAAPGVGITSTVPVGLYGTWEGTSMAAPFVAGAAALVHARFPTLRNTKIVDQITKTAVRIDGPVQARLDLRSTLTALK